MFSLFSFVFSPTESRTKEIVILPPSPRQTEHIRPNDDEIRKLANQVKSIKRKRQTINLIAIGGSSLVVFINAILYFVLYRNRYVYS